jgi:secreted trypsin-like serine protease
MTTNQAAPEVNSPTGAAPYAEASPCGGCRSTNEPELRLAVENLSRKYTRLAELVAQTLSETAVATGDRALVDRVDLLARIVGGLPTLQGDFPDCALIGRRSPTGSTAWFCTGVLVHPSVVLTAGHCQSPFAGINVVGLNAIDIQDLGSAEIIDVRRARVSPQYRMVAGNDITVLILRQPSTVTPVPIAQTPEVAAATQVTLVGFGNSDVKSTKGFGRQRQVTVDITNVRGAPGDDLDEAEQVLGFESDREFTAGGGGFDSCNGDSGGPAFIDVGGIRKLAGLTSRGAQGALQPCGEGGIYTRVDTQRPFINQVLQDAGIPDQL